MHAGVSGGVRVAIALAAVAALGTAAPGTARAQDGSEQAPLSYRISAEVGGSPWGEWIVTQGRELALARLADAEATGDSDDVALVAGPAVGGLPAEPVDMGLLSTVFDPAARFVPGFWKNSTYASGTAVVDSLRIDFREGDDHEAIDGRGTRHHVLTARLWWRHVADEGPETAVFEHGTADLWFASDLPFSWLPFAVHPASQGLAFPLAHTWPEVAWVAIAEYGERLETLGLLLRARTRDQIVPTENPAATSQLVGIEHQRSVSVSDVSTADRPPDAAPFSDLPRVSRSRATIVDVALFLLEPCGSLASKDVGSYEFIASSPQREYLGGGSGALFVTDDGREDGYSVATGVVRDGSAECTVIMIPGESPREGTFPVLAPGAGFAQPPSAGDRRPGFEDSALGLHVQTDGRTINRILILDGGSVRIDQAGPSGVSGKLEATAWGLELHPDYPRVLIEDFAVNVTFQAVPAEEG